MMLVVAGSLLAGCEQGPPADNSKVVAPPAPPKPATPTK